MPWFSVNAVALASLLLLASCGSSETESKQSSEARRDSLVGAWSTAPYGPYPLGPLTRETPVGSTPGSVNTVSNSVQNFPD